MVMIIASIFLFGLAIGSFLNVIIYRTLHGSSPLKGRSKCPKCKKTIRVIDNIPLLSYLFLRGRCRYCKTAISWSYPVVELLTGVLFVWWFFAGSLFFRLTQSPFTVVQPIFWLLIGILLLAIFFSDLLYGIIPNVLIGIIILAAFVYRLILWTSGIMQSNDFINSLYSAIGVLLFFLLLILLTRGKGMGMGDAKLSFAVAMILGWPRIMIAMFISFVTGAIVASVLMVLGKKKFGQTIPFGPFMVIGTLFALIWGGDLWSRYFAPF